MKRLLIIITLILTCLITIAQETPPAVGVNFKQLSTSSFYINLPDSSIWQYKGTLYGWARLGRFKDIKDSLKNYQKLPNSVISGHTITSSGNTITVTTGSYRINGAVYSAPQRIFNPVALSPSGKQRYVTFIGKTNGTVDTLGGVADTIAVYPVIAFNQANLGSVIVGSSSIGQPSTPVEILAGGVITSNDVIGFNAGTNITAAQFIQNVFYKSQVPTASISGGFTQELRSAGSTVYSLNWSAGRQGATQPLSSIVVAGVTQTFAQPVAGASVSGTQSVTVTHNTNINYFNTVTTIDSKSSSAGTTFTFLPKRYFGRSSSATPNNAIILATAGGGSELTGGRNGTFIITASGSNFPYFAYPTSFGALTSIKDVNNFEILSSFNITTVSVTNASNFTQNYLVYTLNATTASNFQITTQ